VALSFGSVIFISYICIVTLKQKDMSKVNLHYLVGNRFPTIEALTETLKNWGAENPHVFESESEILEGMDFQLDGCFNKGSDDDSDYFTLYFIRDRANNFYITETSAW
jgi:hypothetical protein